MAYLKGISMLCKSGVYQLYSHYILNSGGAGNHYKLPYVLIPISIISYSESRILYWSFSATACPPGHWIVEEVMSLHVWTQWRLSRFPSPPQSPLLTFLRTQDHQKPGASSNSSAATGQEVGNLSQINCLYELPDCF